MHALALLLGTLTLAADQPTAHPSQPDLAPPPAAPAQPSPPVAGSWGLEALMPQKRTGRLLEQPVSLVAELGRPLGGPAEWALRAGVGYAQLSRSPECGSTWCRPALGVSLGGLLRLTTPRGRAVAGWLSLGAGIGGATNWVLNTVGVYARADAGLDVGGGPRAVRVAVGWIEAAMTDSEPRLAPGPQRYLAVTVALVPR